MENKFYAIYNNTNDVLIFDLEEERNTYVEEEVIVHPDCACATYDDVKNIINGRTPVFDDGFGCMAILF